MKVTQFLPRGVPRVAVVAGVIDDHTTGTDDVHDASAVSFIPTGSIEATNVQDAIEELLAEGGSGSSFWGPILADDPALTALSTGTVWLPLATIDGEPVFVEYDAP